MRKEVEQKELWFILISKNQSYPLNGTVFTKNLLLKQILYQTHETFAKDNFPC